MKRLLTMVFAAAMMLSCVGGVMAEEPAKPVILVVSFGTSYNDSREITIGAIEEQLAAAYPDFEVRRAFTAQTIIDKLKERDGIEIDNVTEAMERLIADGVRQVIVQPTHIMNGFEYDDLVAETSVYADQFDAFAIGKPLLTEAEDYEAVTAALLADNEHIGEADTAIVYMGHGTEHYANATYCQLEYVMHAEGYDSVFVGTVEGIPTVDQVIAQLSASEAKKVVLYPLMIVAGDHANNDMAGDEEDSWKTLLTQAGFEVECQVHGLGENEKIREIYVEHAAAAMEAVGLK